MTTSPSDSHQTPATAYVRGSHRLGTRPALDDIRACQPPPMSEGWIGLIERKFSLRVSWLLVQTPVSANQITGMWLLLGVIAAGLISTGHYWLTLVGAALYLLVLILDDVDGEVARYKKIQSLIGIYLDLAGHNMIKSLIFIGISFGFYRDHPSLWVLVLGISASISLAVGDNLRFYRTYILARNNLLGEPAVKNRFLRMIGKLEFLWRSQGLYSLTFIGALTGGLLYVLVFYGVTNPLWMLATLRRNIKELQSISAHGNDKNVRHEIIPD